MVKLQEFIVLLFCNMTSVHVVDSTMWTFKLLFSFSHHIGQLRECRKSLSCDPNDSCLVLFKLKKLQQQAVLLTPLLLLLWSTCIHTTYCDNSVNCVLHCFSTKLYFLCLHGDGDQYLLKSLCYENYF